MHKRGVVAISKSSRLISTCGIGVVAVFVRTAQASPAAENKACVSLILSEASPKSDREGDSTFPCKVKIDNVTREGLVVKSQHIDGQDHFEGKSNLKLHDFRNK